ncbi:hypothetical protein STEG23_022316, partial [Scotinomys teguina]
MESEEISQSAMWLGAAAANSGEIELSSCMRSKMPLKAVVSQSTALVDENIISEYFYFIQVLNPTNDTFLHIINKSIFVNGYYDR